MTSVTGLALGAASSRAARSGRMLREAQIDDLGAAILLLARELWVACDRQYVLEAVLDERGIDVSAAIRDHQPSPELSARLSSERERFTTALMDSLCPAEEG